MKRTLEQQKAHHELMARMLAALKAGGLREFDNLSVERFFAFALEREFFAKEQLEMGEGSLGYLQWVQEILREVKAEMTSRGISDRKFACQSRRSLLQRL